MTRGRLRIARPDGFYEQSAWLLAEPWSLRVAISVNPNKRSRTIWVDLFVRDRSGFHSARGRATGIVARDGAVRWDRSRKAALPPLVDEYSYLFEWLREQLRALAPGEYAVASAADVGFHAPPAAFRAPGDPTPDPRANPAPEPPIQEFWAHRPPGVVTWQPSGHYELTWREGARVWLLSYEPLAAQMPDVPACLRFYRMQNVTSVRYAPDHDAVMIGSAEALRHQTQIELRGRDALARALDAEALHALGMADYLRFEQMRARLRELLAELPSLSAGRPAARRGKMRR